MCQWGLSLVPFFMLPGRLENAFFIIIYSFSYSRDSKSWGFMKSTTYHATHYRLMRSGGTVSVGWPSTPKLPSGDPSPPFCKEAAHTTPMLSLMLGRQHLGSTHAPAAVTVTGIWWQKSSASERSVNTTGRQMG